MLIRNYLIMKSNLKQQKEENKKLEDKIATMRTYLRRIMMCTEYNDYSKVKDNDVDYRLRKIKELVNDCEMVTNPETKDTCKYPLFDFSKNN